MTAHRGTPIIGSKEKRMSQRKWYREVAHELDVMGIRHTFEQGRKHTKVYIEYQGKKAVLVIPSSPSDFRAIKNVKAMARRLIW